MSSSAAEQARSAKRAARLKNHAAQAEVDAKAARATSTFRTEPLSLSSEGAPLGVFHGTGPPRPVSRAEQLFFYAYTAVAVGGVALLLGYYYYAVRRLRVRWLAPSSAHMHEGNEPFHGRSFSWVGWAPQPVYPLAACHHSIGVGWTHPCRLTPAASPHLPGGRSTSSRSTASSRACWRERPSLPAPWCRATSTPVRAACGAAAMGKKRIW